MPNRTLDELMPRVVMIAPGFYPEQDGGDWYLVAPNHSRIAEGFPNKKRALQGLLWLAGDPKPKGWEIIKTNSLYTAFEFGDGYEGTIWNREAEAALPGALDRLGRS